MFDAASSKPAEEPTVRPTLCTPACVCVQFYRDGGKGKLRPALITLGGPPVPGVCAGLQQGIEGMRVGGRRTFTVPPALGFGAATVLGPYGELWQLTGGPAGCLPWCLLD